ncbi:MAG: serine/threonine-protein kinase [Gammaproteobacteria bacterium]|nr:serine/threonine-protein kinase [Gammaproteobacteria bacterium]
MSDETSNSKSALPEGRPERIGPYRILDTLGEGGMAVVYLAEQIEPVKRRVALKIVKPGMDSKQIIARFESERQALAVLDHPNIAKVFDGGITEHGRPWFAMELVHGIPINDYCDENRLTMQDRIDLFIEVCAAVQHAHLKGLIHRDLKPTNILVGYVDEHPRPKIIDFGIAKATSMPLTEQTLVTKIGQLIGTPQYLSPEQANITGLDVDTRSDVYSLGVVLYELLVGALPLDLAAIGEEAMRAAMLERDPSRPSTRVTQLGDTQDEILKARSTDLHTLRRQLHGDLDWIVMRAIEKDRTRRYETVNALAMECRRFLNHQPVLARPPSPRYLMARFVRRNRRVVVASSIALTAIVAGAAAATVGFIRATEAEQEAVLEAEKSRQVSEFLVDLFEVSDPGEARGNSITAREVLDRGLESIESDLEDQPQVQATLMTTMSKVYENLGLLEVAEELLEKALTRYREIDQPPSKATGHVLHELAGVNVFQGDTDVAEKYELESLEVRRAVFGEVHETIALGLSNLGIIEYYRANYDKSLALLQESVDMLEATIGADHPDATNTVSALSALYWRTGELDKADLYGSMALESKRQHYGDDHPDVAVMLNNQAILKSDQGDMESAERLYLEAFELQKKQLGEHRLVANTMNNIGVFYLDTGDYSRGERMLLAAVDMWSKTLGDDNQKVFIAMTNLGRLYIEMEKFEEAEDYLVRSLAGKRIVHGDEHESTAMSQIFLCDVYNLTSRYAKCEPMARNSLRILEATLREGHPRIGAAKIRVAMSLAGQGNFEEGEPIILAGFAPFDGKGTVDEKRAGRWVARFYRLWGRPEDAARYSFE